MEELNRKEKRKGKTKLQTTEEQLEHLREIMTNLGFRLANKGGLTKSDWEELVIDELNKTYE